MEIIFEFLFELIFEGSFALMEKKKAPMILRILAGMVVFGVFAAVFCALPVISIIMAIIHKSLLMIIPAILLLFVGFLMFYGIYKQRKKRK